MKVTFQLTQDEYIRAFRTHLKPKQRSPLVIILLGFIMICCGVFLIATGEPFWGWSFVAFPIILETLLYAARYFVPRYNYRNHILNRGQYEMDFTEDSIHFKTKHIDSRLSWQMFTHAYSNPEHYLLYYGKNQFSVIPSRVFETKEQLQEFDNLLRQNVKNVKAV